MNYNISLITKNYPPLTSSEEQRMIDENMGNREHMNNLLVLHNVSLVMKIVACDIHGFETHREDLVSAGIEALYKLAEKFDPTLHIKFSTYAYIGVKRSILLFIAQNLGKYRNRANYYLDQKINFKGDSKDDKTVESLVQGLIDPCWARIPSVDEIIETKDIGSLGKSILREFRKMKGMSSRDKKIFLDYVCSSKKTSFRAVGQRYGFSGERIHQIVSRNIPRIQRMIKEKFGIGNATQIWGG